eukprot:m51a1_g5493 hypothetical protein (495) ;mRNA; r:334914-336817
MLDQVVSVCQDAAAVARTLLGPSGRPALVRSFGRTLVTKHAGSVLQDALGGDGRPAATVVLRALSAHAAAWGDGTATLALALAGAVDALGQAVTPEGPDQEREAARMVLETHLRGQFGGGACDVLRDAVLRCAEGSGGRVVGEEAARRLRCLPVVPVAGAASSETAVLEGVAIERALASPAMAKLTQGPVKLVLLTGEISAMPASLPAAVEIRSAAEQQRAAQHSEAVQRRTVEVLHARGVGMVLASCSIPEAARAACLALGMLAVECVLEEDIDMIAQASHVVPLTEVVSQALSELADDEMGAWERAHCAVAKWVRELHTGPLQSVTQLAIDGTQSLVVRAPSEPLAKQYALSARRAARCLGKWSLDPRYVPGGGVWELCVASMCSSSKSVRAKQGVATEAAAVVEAAMLSGEHCTGLVMPTEEEWLLRGAASDCAIGNPLQHGIVEPLCLKVAVLRKALETASQLARIDRIVHVRRLREPHKDKDDKEADAD